MPCIACPYWPAPIVSPTTSPGTHSTLATAATGQVHSYLWAFAHAVASTWHVFPPALPMLTSPHPPGPALPLTVHFTAIIHLPSFVLDRIVEYLLYAVAFTVRHVFHFSSNPQRKLRGSLVELQQKPPPPPRKIPADIPTNEMSSWIEMGRNWNKIKHDLWKSGPCSRWVAGKGGPEKPCSHLIIPQARYRLQSFPGQISALLLAEENTHAVDPQLVLTLGASIFSST